MVDSYGLLSVSVPRGSAAETLGLEAGDELSLVRLTGDDDTEAGGNGATTSSPVVLGPRRRA